MRFSQKYDVHLWLIPLAENINEIQLDILSNTERQRLEKLHFWKDKLLFYSSHVAMRHIISKYLVYNPTEIAYSSIQNGKPILVNPNSFEFNLSHSGELAILGVCEDDLLGVDVELAKNGVEFEKLANRFFSKSEAEKLKNQSDIESAFYRCWTRKEAFIKAIGDGLSYPLKNFQVTFAEDEQPMLESIANHPQEAENWSIIDLKNLPHSYYGAIAVRKKETQLTLRQFNWNFLSSH